MKKYLFLMPLLLMAAHIAVWAQGGQAQYKVAISNLSYELNAGIWDDTKNTHVSVSINFDDGSNEFLYRRYFNDQDDDVRNWNPTSPLITNKKPVSIRNFGFVSFRAGTDASWDETRGVTFCGTTNFNVDPRSPRMSRITYALKITPLHTLVSLTKVGANNTFLPSDDRINLFARAGFDASMYNYQYRLQGETNWKNIAPTLWTLDKLSLSAKDLFGSNYIQNLGKKIEIRIASCLENGDYISFSDPVVLTLVQSAPHILSASTVPVKCFDSTDGKTTLSFDRLLLVGETIGGSLVNTETGTAVPFIFPTDALQTSTGVTIDNLSPGKYQLDLSGNYLNEATYTDGNTHNFIFEILKPAPVQFSSASKTDVFCFNGTDGKINLTASGGVGGYQYAITGDNGLAIAWTNFDSSTDVAINNLIAGTYQIKVRDANQCPAKEAGTEKVLTIKITQPTAAIALSELEIKQPTGYGLSNGYIALRVTGGTQESDGYYHFEWRKGNAAGNLITTGIITDAANNPFTIKLDGLAAGKYYLTVKDKNYANASSELQNCGVISQEFEVTQPELLVATITAKQLVSCNIYNEYPYRPDNNNNGIPDDAEDASLTATITGGVGTYQLQWQKQIGGVFQNINGANWPLWAN